MVGFQHDKHAWVDERHDAGPPSHAGAAQEVHGDSLVGRINQKIGLWVTLLVGTMWAAYIFMAISFFSAPDALRSHDPITMVNWVSQSFLQLVLLPVIIVGQNIQAKAADARAQATFDDASATLHEASEIQKHLAAQDEALTRLLAHMEKLGEK